MVEFAWLNFIVFTIVIVGTPGPATISVLHSGINYGFKKSFPYLVGVVMGFSWNLSMAAFGVTILEHQILYRVLQYTMLAYIFSIAYKIATSAPLEQGSQSKPLNFFQGLLLNSLNPKAYIAAFLGISQFSIPSSYWASALVIVGGNLIIALSVQNCWALLGQYIAKLFAHPTWYKPVNYLLAISLVLSVILPYLSK